MADNPIFPEDENLDNAREYRSIQKDIGVYLKNQVEFLKEKASLSRSVQEQLEAQNKKDKAHVLDIQKQMGTLYGLIEQRIKVEGTEADALEHQIKSVRNEVKLYRDLVALSQDRMALAIQADKEQQAESFKWVNIVKNGLQEITGLDAKELTLSKKIGDEIIGQKVESKALAYSIGAIVMMLKGAFDLFKKMDAAAWDFRKAMGMTRMESAVIRKDAERLAIDYMAMGVTIDQVYKSYQAIGQTVGGVHNVTKDMARDVSLMASQFGISEETSAEFMRNLTAVSRSTLESQQNMLGLAQSISAAAGVNLGQVMQDVSKASGTTLTMMSRIPNTALRTAIELRHMGTSLEEASKSSRQLLNFSENIQDEMDASVLLGRSINLQRARELAYSRDLEGSTKEVLRIAKSVKFEQLDTFQQEAFARATGKSVDELMRMLQTDRQLAQIKRNGTAAQKAELAAYEKMRKENEATAKLRAKDAMVQIRTMANQQRIVQIQNKWNELLAKAQQFLLPVIDKLLAGALILVDLAPAIMACISPLSKAVVFVGEWLSTGTKLVSVFAMILTPLATMGGFFEKIATIALKVGIGISKFLGPIGKTLGFLGKFLGFFGKLLGPIGWVIMAFQAISGFISGWNNTTGSWLKKLGGGLLGILEGVIPGFSYIEKFLGWMWSKVGGIATFLFKWFTPVGLIIQAFKGLKKLLPETFAALGNLFDEIWGTALSIGKSMFTLWLAPIKMVWTWIKSIGTAMKESFSAGFGMVKLFFGVIGSSFRYVKTMFTQMFTGWAHKVDHFLASIINGLTSIGSRIVGALTKPFSDALNWIKSWWGGKSPSKLGLAIVQGLKSVGHLIYSALTSPFTMALGWIRKHIPGASMLLGNGDASKSVRKPVETRAMAAYIPAVTVSPSGTKIETTSTPKPVASKGKDKSSVTLDDVLDALNTQNKLLEKILAKDPNIKMDGQLLGTTLARQTEFKGGYGVNKV